MVKIKTDKYEFEYKDKKYENNKISPYLEIQRIKEINRLNFKLHNILNRKNAIPKKRTNEQISKMTITKVIFAFINKTDKDPFFPSIRKNKLVSEHLMSVYKNVDEKKANEIEKELDLVSEFKKAIKKLCDMDDKKIKIQKKIKDGKVFYKSGIYKDYIPISVFDRLKKRYLEYKSKNKHEYSLDYLIFTLLLRYKALDSGGNQWGMPFTIRQRFKTVGFDFECFASAFNHYYKYYCSMFYDIEKYFMSIGSFNNVNFIKGAYMANPPYEMQLLNNMVDKMHNSCKSNKDVLFMFGLPDWSRYDDDIYFIDRANKSKYYKWHIKFEKYTYPWHDFITCKTIKIPQSFRYIFSNYESFDLEAIKKIMYEWKTL
jgi:hypothetical protein